MVVADWDIFTHRISSQFITRPDAETLDGYIFAKTHCTTAYVYYALYSIGVCTERLGIHVCLVQHVKNCSCVNLFV